MSDNVNLHTLVTTKPDADLANEHRKLIAGTLYGPAVGVGEAFLMFDFTKFVVDADFTGKQVDALIDRAWSAFDRYEKNPSASSYRDYVIARERAIQVARSFGVSSQMARASFLP